MILIEFLLSPLVALSSDQIPINRNQGWPAEFDPIYTALSPSRHYAAAILVLPEVVLDFRSPDDLKSSVFQYTPTDLKKVGHAAVAWKCGIDPIGYASQTGERSNQFERAVEAGWGLSILFAKFGDGFLDSKIGDAKRFVFENSNGSLTRILFLAYEVSERECVQISEFVEKYSQKNPDLGFQEPWRFFGLNMDPQKFEGGGCGSFASAALAQTELFKNAHYLFWRKLAISPMLLGRPSPDLALKNTFAPVLPWLPTTQKISKADLLLRSWGRPLPDENPTALPADSKLQVLRLVDPELQILFVSTIINWFYPRQLAPREIPLRPQSPMHSEASPSLSSADVLPVDEHLDVKASQVVSNARNFIAQSQSSQDPFISRRGHYKNTEYIILDRSK